MELDGRTAVVVGGGSGVGRGIALGLAAEGMGVVVADIDAGSAAAVCDEIVDRGGVATSTRVDATDRSSLAELAASAVAAHGAIHVVTNTVGVILDRPLDRATDVDWAWFFDFNIMATVRTVDVFLPHLRKHGGPAHIVTTSSMAGLLALGPDIVGGVHNGLYTTTKHALIGYADMLCQELAPEGIGVSVLCPGLVAGNLMATSARNRPERFGGALPPPERQGMPKSATPNEEVGPVVADAIAANRFYIFTHPEVREMLEQRHQQVLDDLRAAEQARQARG